LPGAPCTYYGGEVGVMGGIDPDSRRAFPWDESRWDGVLLQSVRAAFGLRRVEPALRADGVSVLAAEGGGLAFERRDGDRRLAVALNAGEEAVRLRLAAEGAQPPAEPLLDTLLAVGRSKEVLPTLLMEGERLSIDLAPRSGAVIGLR